MIDPGYIQRGYEDCLIKNLLISPEDLLSRYWDDLKKDLEDKVKSNPSLSEFFDLEYLKSRFKERLTEIHSSLENDIRGIDYLKTLKKNKLELDFSESNIDPLSSSILLQIAGRQRDEASPFKNIINLFYRIKRRGERQLTKEEFLLKQDQKKKETINLLTAYSALTSEQQISFLKKLKDGITVSKYSGDFVSISKHTNQPVYNYLIDIADERAWEVSQKDYQDKISVTKSLEEEGFEVSEYQTEDDKIVSEFLNNHFYKTNIFQEKMKMYCKFMDTHQGETEILERVNSRIPNPRFSQFYNYFGTKGCSSKNYREKYLLEAWGNDSKEEKLRKEIYFRFKPGDRYPAKTLKEMVGEIYKSLGITRNPKATDLRKYFKLIKTRITLPDKSVVNGFKLESLV